MYIHVLCTYVCTMCLKIRRDTQLSFTRCCLHFSRVWITGVHTKLLVRVLGTKLRSLCLHGTLPSDISLQARDRVIYNEEKYIGSWFWSLGILRSWHWQLQKVFWLCHHIVEGERVRESKVGRKTNFILFDGISPIHEHGALVPQLRFKDSTSQYWYNAIKLQLGL